MRKGIVEQDKDANFHMINRRFLKPLRALSQGTRVSRIPAGEDITRLQFYTRQLQLPEEEETELRGNNRFVSNFNEENVRRILAQMVDCTEP